MTRIVFGVDPGTANLGWAAVDRDTTRVLGLGSIRTEPNRELDASTENLTRSRQCSRALLIAFAGYARDATGIIIATEALLTFGNPQAIASNALPQGALGMMAEVYGVDLHVVPPATWQRAIIGKQPKAPKPAPTERRKKGGPKTDHRLLYAKITDYIRRNGTPLAVENLDALGGITASNHALDACGIALYCALGRPTTTIRHGAPDHARP